MTATMLALWPNMEVFAPVAYLLDFKDGMVSYQLNPNYADDYDNSIADAVKIYSEAESYFSDYDRSLLFGWPNEYQRGRPNIVFKVAGTSAIAKEITKRLESMGIGTNNTVTFTVSQEVELILSKIEGMATAARNGIRSTKNYETNMGGRLEDHLREEFASQLVLRAIGDSKDSLSILYSLAKKLGFHANDSLAAWAGPNGWGYEIVANTIHEKVSLVTSRQYLKKLDMQEFVGFQARNNADQKSTNENILFLQKWEQAIGLSGTLVAQRVWWIFFSQENRQKWIEFIISSHRTTRKQAEEILSNIDVLPASKRKANDTFFALSSNNITNTEFPDHQSAVQEVSTKKDFDLMEFENSIEKKREKHITDRLSELVDFRKAFELTPNLFAILTDVGIDVSDFGTEGLTSEHWGDFGPATKTMKGFVKSYDAFKDKVITIARQVAAQTT
jgi:Fe2+ transport system protein FeoA